MDPNQERQFNQAAYRQLSGFIQHTYPPGRFVAISGGKIVADAVSFEEINKLLHQMGIHSADVLVVQAGADYPETAVILLQGLPSSSPGVRVVFSGSEVMMAGCS